MVPELSQELQFYFLCLLTPLKMKRFLIKKSHDEHTYNGSFNI